ncbi:GNAT family N-acetyltransferase [uncultured Dokdonia sp.]|uniref:GNAT family N-acetyltransferase n=1 Tax=uncultured Dokdonia sp. TaxID=575653 RepID=UPI002612F241|nr:GNAT family N-acetyltransferase [uncultured Dokdonia sp.]
MYIRLATLQDLEALVPLFDGYRVFYRQSSDEDKARSFLKERLTNLDSVIYIAFAKSNVGDSRPTGERSGKADSETAVGFTQLYPIFSSVSMERMYILNDLYIHADHRNLGIGQALINEVKELCHKEHQKGIVIQTETTNPAQHLYERLGFTKDPDLHYFWATN